MQKFWISLILLVSVPGLAKSRAYLGADLGMTAPSYEDTTPRPHFSAVGGAKFDGEWGVGAFLLNSTKAEDKFDINLYGIEGNYNFEGNAPDAYVFARYGFSNVKAANETFGPTAMGLGAGYDVLFGSLALNLEFAYYAFQSKQKSTGVELKEFNLMSFSAGLKFFF